jgi:hypothetical protein
MMPAVLGLWAVIGSGAARRESLICYVGLRRGHRCAEGGSTDAGSLALNVNSVVDVRGGYVYVEG